MQSYCFQARTFFQGRSVVDNENKDTFTLIRIKYFSRCFVLLYFQVLLKQSYSDYNPFRYFSIDIVTMCLSKSSSCFYLLSMLFLIVKDVIYLSIYTSMYLPTYYLSVYLSSLKFSDIQKIMWGNSCLKNTCTRVNLKIEILLGKISGKKINRSKHYINGPTTFKTPFKWE